MIKEKQDNKRTFIIEDKEDKSKREYAIVRPNAAQNEESNLEYTRVFSKAVKAGALLRETVLNYMREQGLWSDAKDLEYITHLRDLNVKEKKLKKGGIKLSEAKQIAEDMQTLRARLQELIAEKNSLDSNTAQGQAETSRFNFLLSQCLVYNDNGERVFSDVDHFLRNQSSLVAIKAAEVLANMWYGLSENYEKTLPENQFLKKFEFVDDELRLINEQGELVSTDGKKVDEEGRYVDEDGKLIDYEGDPVDEEGEYNFPDAVFLDEDGEPINKEKEEGSSEQPEEEEKKKAATKRGRPKKKTAEVKD